MNNNKQKYPRILAIAPSTRGFGFAVFEEQDTLVDWGVKRMTGDKNTRSVAKVKEMIIHYQPGMIVMEDTSSKTSRRVVRIRKLSQTLIALAASQKISVKLFAREIIQKVICPNSKGTRCEVANAITERFPEELGFLLPPKRSTCQSNDYRMDIFEAVALVLMPRKCR